MNRTTNTESPLISVVIPLYKEESNVRPLVERIETALSRSSCRWELVFALDPSPDRTREEILGLIESGHQIKLLIFSRRIGKPLSLLAGLEHAAGDACVIIDADLQDPPELIEEMISKWREGFDVVIPQRVSRKGESLLYLKCAETFYRVLEKIGEVHVPRNTGDFRLLDARVVSEVCRFKERHGFLRGMVAHAGFRTALIPYHREARFTGKTQIPIWGAVNIALDGIVPFSRTPVRAIFWLGVLVAVFSLFAAGIGAGLALAGQAGHWYPFIFLSVIMGGLTGLVLVCMGILGEYLVRAYEDSRGRPLYAVDELHQALSNPKNSGSEDPQPVRRASKRVP